MTIKNFFYTCAVIALVGFSSCSKDDKKEDPQPDTCNNWDTKYQNALENYTNAAIAFDENQTPATCNAYKTTGFEFIDAIEALITCPGWTAEAKAEFQQSIAEAKENLAEFSCEE